ncbi:hypothetical protein HY464_01370, partial [Candidatus Peregrinibacteria bacterium]|nr:hypothetical protein [Candidatus Peregrinibacteria bacterium]
DGTNETLTFLNAEDRFEFSDDLRITGGTYASGALIVDGATTLKSTLRLNGVTYTFPTSDGSASGKVLKTNSAGVLSWSTDLNTGGLSYADAQSYFVDDGGDTMTGALVIRRNSGTYQDLLTVSGGRIVVKTVVPDNTVNILHVSGGSLAVSGNASLSGTLLSVGTITTRGDLTLNADQTNANTLLTFGSDGTNETLTFLNAEDRFEFSDDLSVTGTLSASGAVSFEAAFYVDATTLVVDATNNRVGILQTGPEVALDVVGTISGAILYASSGINSSGAVIIKTPVTTSSALGGSGALVVMQRIEFSTGAYIYASGATILALDSPIQSDAVTGGGIANNTPHIVFGYRGNFDTNLYRLTGSVLRTDDNFYVGQDFVIGTGSITTAESSNIPNGSVLITSGILCVDDGGQNCDDAARVAGTVYAEVGSITTIDLAENYPTKDHTIHAGEIVALDRRNPVFVQRATGQSGEVLLGIVSTRPGLLLGGFSSPLFPNDRKVPVALAGRVPTQVDGTGGPITVGDRITISSDGFGKKSRGGEQTVGYALEEFSGVGTGIIEVFVHLQGGDDEVHALVQNGIRDGEIDRRVEESIRAQVEGMIAKTLGSGAAVKGADKTVTEDGGSVEDFLVNGALSVVGPVTFGDTLRIGEAVMLDGALSVAGPAAFTGSVEMGTLMARVAEIEGSISVFGDTRMGGDLYLEGALRAHDLFVPGTLRIDGDASIAGTFTAERILAGSGSIVSGLLTINGDLRISSGSLILGSGSLLTVQDILIEKALVVLGDITIKGLAMFEKNVEIRGELRVSDQQAGYALIPQGGTGVTVQFGTGLTVVPIVTATPDVPVLYAVSRATRSGFIIRLAGPALEDVTFSWLALLTSFPKTYGAISIHPESTSSSTSLMSETGSSSVHSEDAPQASEQSDAIMPAAPVSMEGSSSSDTSESQESSSSSSLPSVESSSSSMDTVVEEHTEFPITSNQ